MGRTGKVMSLSEAVQRFVPDNCFSLAVGGMHMHNNPMALVREVIRQHKRVKRLITSPSACINADLLIGTGLVEEVLTSYIGFEHLGLAPNFRRAVEDKTINLLECDEAFLVYGLQAGAGGLPFIPYPQGLELSDIPRVNPEMYRYTLDPYSGKQVMTAQPIKPSIALVHCQAADQNGNALFAGAEFTDRLMIFAADKVIVQTEKLVANLAEQYGSTRVNVPGFLVAAVVVAPFGCHPTSSHGNYTYDVEHLKGYLKACKNPESFGEYCRQYVTGISEQEYAQAVGGDVLTQLELGGELFGA